MTVDRQDPDLIEFLELDQCLDDAHVAFVSCWRIGRRPEQTDPYWTFWQMPLLKTHLLVSVVIFRQPSSSYFEVVSQLEKGLECRFVCLSPFS